MEKERLIFCIERFDHYYDSVNNKSSVFMGLGTFVGGGLIALYPFLKEHVSCSQAIWLLLLLAVVLAFLAVIIVLTASIPYIKKGKQSLFYFNSIAGIDKGTFMEESLHYAKDQELEDLREQVHSLALGLNKKFIILRYAGVLFTVMFVTLIPLAILILLNFKH